MPRPKPAEEHGVYSARLPQNLIEEFKGKYGAGHPNRLETLIRADLATASVEKFEEEAQAQRQLAGERKQQAQQLQDEALRAEERAENLAQAAVTAKERQNTIRAFIGPKFQAERDRAITDITNLLLQDNFVRAREVAEHRVTGLQLNFAQDIPSSELMDEALIRAGKKVNRDGMFG